MNEPCRLERCVMQFVKTSSSRRFACMTIVIFSAVSNCYGQQANDLQQQLQQMKAAV
jgi:hypothetical protein